MAKDKLLAPKVVRTFFLWGVYDPRIYMMIFPKSNLDISEEIVFVDMRLAVILLNTLDAHEDNLYVCNY